MKDYLKILAVLVVAYVVTIKTNDIVFIANSPQIRPHVHLYVLAKIINFPNQLRDLYLTALNSHPEQKAEKLPLKYVSQGVYAQEDKQVTRTIIKDEEVRWVQYDFTINGKIISIRVPEGQDPPTLDKLKNITN